MKSCLACLLMLFTHHSFAQQRATISGRVIEQGTTFVLPSASVVLQAEGEIFSGTLTDAEGHFVLTGIPPGTYLLGASYVGYKPAEMAVFIGENNAIYDVGTIALAVATGELDEVVVEGDLEALAAEMNQKSFNLADNIAQAGGSVLDAMKALPGVTVDQEGNVHLRGSDQVAVLIDGKQSSLTGYGNQKGLDAIPAGNIERIEIINNPSARHDASGMAGLINIVYKKESETGFNAELGLAAGLGNLVPQRDDLPTQLGSYSMNPKYIPSLNLNYRTPKTNIFLQSEVLHQDRLPNNEFTTRHYNDGSNTVSQVPENRNQTHYIVKGGSDWYLDDFNTLTLSSVFDYESHIDRAQIPFINQDTDQRYRYWFWTEDEVTGLFNVTADYERRFKEAGHQLKLNAQYTRGWEDEQYFLNDSTAIRQSVDTTHIVATEHTALFQVDYVKPLRSGRLESGGLLRLRTIPVTYDVGRGVQSIIYQDMGDWSDWGENNVAGYINYIYEKPAFDIEAGLRAEHTDVSYDIAPENRYYDQSDAYNYFELYPNVRFTYRLNDINGLSLFYNRRVDRPGEPELRIFPKYDDPELLKVGNPYLRPQFTQTAELAYRRIWESGSLFLSTYYRRIEDPFTRVYSVDSLNANYTIINKIFQNVGSATHQGVELLLSQNVKPFWKLSTSLNIYNNKIDAYTGTLLFPFERPFTIEETEDATWDAKLSSQFFLPGETQLQLTALYFAPKNIAQGKELARSSVDVGFQRSIMNSKGEITISFTDLFNKFRIRQEIQEEGFTALYQNYFETQVVRVGFKYKL